MSKKNWITEEMQGLQGERLYNKRCSRAELRVVEMNCNFFDIFIRRIQNVSTKHYSSYFWPICESLWCKVTCITNMIAQLKNVDIGVKLSVPWLIIRARVDLKFQSPVWAEGPYWRLKKFEIGLALMISQGTDNFTPIYTFFSCATMFVIQVTLHQGDSNIS